MTPREQHLERRIESLKTALDLAQQRIDELEKAFGSESEITQLQFLGLGAQEARAVHLLLTRGVVTKPQLLLAMYADEPDKRFDVQDKVVDVVLCNARKKLARCGVTFGRIGEVRSNPGVQMLPKDKARLRSLIASRAALLNGSPSDQRTRVNRIIASQRKRAKVTPEMRMAAE